MEMSGKLHTSDTLLLGKQSPSTHYIAGWMVHRLGLDKMVKRKIPVSAPVGLLKIILLIIQQHEKDTGNVVPLPKHHFTEVI
jgi:hypothetical protein